MFFQKLMFHLITIHVEWVSDQVDLIEMLLTRLLPQNETRVFLSRFTPVFNCGAEIRFLPDIFKVYIIMI